MKRERLVRVKDEGELRVGMIVVVKNCGGGDDYGCGKTHRFMLVSHDDCRNEKHTCSRSAWLPAPKPTHYLRGLCPTAAVFEGRLYRVVDEQLTDTDEGALADEKIAAQLAAMRERERVR